MIKRVLFLESFLLLKSIIFDNFHQMKRIHILFDSLKLFQEKEKENLPHFNLLFV